MIICALGNYWTHGDKFCTKCKLQWAEFYIQKLQIYSFWVSYFDGNSTEKHHSQWGYSEQFNHRLFISSSYSSRMAILASVGDHLSSLLEHLIYIWMFNCICALLSSTCTLSSIMHFIFLHNSTIKQSFHCIPNLYKTVFPYLFHEAKTTFISHLSTAILLWSRGGGR